jgi:hypothetical protein
MRLDLDPSEMTPDERRREVVCILARGLHRLRDRYALDANPVPENPPDPSESCLEAVALNPLTVHDG